MAPKNAVAQSSRKATRSTSQGSTTVSAASNGVKTKSMAKVAASSAREQAVVIAVSQSRKSTNGDSKIADEVSQIASHSLKQKSIVGYNMPQTISRGMDELQTHTNLTFQPIDLEDYGYSSSASSLLSSKESLLLHDEVESSNTIIMPVMLTEVTNIEEQLGSMKATRGKLLKEIVEKNV